jgi:NitT/TauT family transport system substrate-binding protein
MKQVILIAAVMLAGCGEHSKDASVRIAMSQGSLGQVPVTLAADLRFFHAQGVTVELEQIPNPSKAIEALLANSADVAVGTFESVLLLAADGQPVRVFVNLLSRDIRGIVALPGAKGIRSVSDLRGKNVGVSGLGSATHTFLKHVLIQNGIPLEEVSVAGIGMGLPAVAALERGVVDAATVAAGDLLRLKYKHPELVILADSSTAEGSRAVWGSDTLPTISLLARPAWLEAHPAEAGKIARALQQTLQWLQDHTPAEIRERMPAATLTSDVAADLAAITAMKEFWSKDGLIPDRGTELVRQAMAVSQEKIRKADIDISKTFTNQFVLEGQ